MNALSISIKRHQLSTRADFFNCQKRVHIHFKSLCQKHQFGIRNTAELRLDFREGATTQIPAKNRTPGSKHLLRHLLLITQFSDLRADNVFRLAHAPEMELDSRMSDVMNCSIIGAICKVASASVGSCRFVACLWKLKR